MAHPTRIILGLGSNLSPRKERLHQAISRLQSLGILNEITRSRIYENPALLPEDAPAEWNQSFLNMAISGDCRLAPEDLLDAIKQLEIMLGREHRGHWGPREIDIDILLYGPLEYQSERLHLPHPGLLVRAFALLPAAECEPDMIPPTARQSLQQLAAAMDQSTLTLWRGEAA